MAKIEKSALIMFSAQQMYNLVNDVTQYPQFLPGCVAARVIEQSDEHMLAQLDVAKLGLSQSFSTRNELVAPNRINIALASGPFKQLNGYWQFIELDEQACKIVFELEFEFESKMVEFAFGKIFNELVGAMVQAFCSRAKEVYR